MRYTEYVVLPPESAWKFRVWTGERSPLLSKRGTLKEGNKNVFIVLHGVKKKTNDNCNKLNLILWDFFYSSKSCNIVLYEIILKKKRVIKCICMFNRHIITPPPQPSKKKNDYRFQGVQYLWYVVEGSIKEAGWSTN